MDKEVKTPVLDFLIVFVVIVGVIIAYFMITSNTKSQAEEQVQDWKDFNVYLDGVKVCIPLSVDDLQGIGYNMSGNHTDDMFTVENTKGQKLSVSLSDNKIVGIRTINDTDAVAIELNNSVQLGYTLNKVEEIMGEPTDSGIFADCKYATYIVDDDSYIEFQFNESDILICMDIMSK